MNKALVIGIDDYPGHALNCCVNDATEVAALLQTNKDGGSNFDMDLRISSASSLTNHDLQEAISRFFTSSTPAETAVLYFAGHGVINPHTDAGYIMGTDARKGALGLSLSELLSLANEAYPKIQSSVLILDCCHAGFLGGITGASTGSAAVIGPGVTILSSSNADEVSVEAGHHGVFTHLLLDALNGGCADVRGNITPAAVYTHIDQALGANEQRPLYKANVHRFVTLRKVTPAIPPEVLRRLALHFPNPDMLYELDPSFEPDRKNVPANIKKIPVNPVNAAAFAELQMYNRQGLVVPVGVPPPNERHMYYAAIQSKACALTPMGKHYQRLAARKKL